MSYMDDVTGKNIFQTEAATDGSGLLRVSINGIKEQQNNWSTCTIFGIGASMDDAIANHATKVTAAKEAGTYKDIRTSHRWTKG